MNRYKVKRTTVTLTEQNGVKVPPYKVPAWEVIEIATEHEPHRGVMVTHGTEALAVAAAAEYDRADRQAELDS